MATADLVGCPHCGRPIAYSRELAGQIIGCPHCGGKLQMPVMPPGRAPTAPPPTAPSRPASFENATEGPTRKPQKEPWYYGFIHGYANLLLWVAILSTLTLALMFGYTVLKPFNSVLIAEQGVRGWVLASLIWLGFALFLIAQLLAVVCGIALMLLGVDAARNIRAIREKVSQDG